MLPRATMGTVWATVRAEQRICRHRTHRGAAAGEQMQPGRFTQEQRFTQEVNLSQAVVVADGWMMGSGSVQTKLV